MHACWKLYCWGWVGAGQNFRRGGMYSMGVLVVVDGHKPGMYSLGVLVLLVDGHKSGPGRKACVLTVLAARDGLQHI